MMKVVRGLAFRSACGKLTAGAIRQRPRPNQAAAITGCLPLRAGRRSLRPSFRNDGAEDGPRREGPLPHLGPWAHLPLVEGKISGPCGAGQYLRRALSACFLDFSHCRGRVDFCLCLFARRGNVIEPRPKTINPDCSLHSMCLSGLPVSAAQASYPHHVDGNLGLLRQARTDRSGADQRRQ
jgi:hypothetical protein